MRDPVWVAFWWLVTFLFCVGTWALIYQVVMT